MNIYFAIISLLYYALVASQQVNVYIDSNAGFYNSGSNIVGMVNDYTLDNKITEASMSDKTIIFSLNKYKNKETHNQKIIKVAKEWISYFMENPLPQKEDRVDLLNQLIINTTNTLLNMCNKMIEKTTSILPLSYSYKLSTDFEMYSENQEETQDGFLSYFSSSKQVIVTDTPSQLKEQIAMDLYTYQQYRSAINSRKLFLNSLCDNTFEDPYTLHYNSENNTILFTYNPNKINYYIVIIQNIIDNSNIRNLNRGFKEKKDKMGNKKEENYKYNGIRFDIDLDIDKDKTESLVEKAKYILPFLQKFERQLPIYLELTSKRSLTIDEYFINLNYFWKDVLEHAKIGSHNLPFEFKNELSEKEAVRLKHETEILEKELKRLDADKKAEVEANRIIQEFRNKQRIEDAHNYVREQKILQTDKKYNYSNIEWSQYKNKIKQRVRDFTDVFIYGINGLLKSPLEFIVNFTSDTIFDIGKIAFMILILVSICSYIYRKIISIF
jgi:hypothetical protein